MGPAAAASRSFDPVRNPAAPGGGANPRTLRPGKAPGGDAVEPRAKPRAAPGVTEDSGRVRSDGRSSTCGPSRARSPSRASAPGRARSPSRALSPSCASAPSCDCSPSCAGGLSSPKEGTPGTDWMFDIPRSHIPLVLSDAGVQADAEKSTTCAMPSRKFPAPAATCPRRRPSARPSGVAVSIRCTAEGEAFEGTRRKVSTPVLEPGSPPPFRVSDHPS